MSKKFLSVVLCVALVLTCSISIYAATNSVSGYIITGYNCSGYLNVNDNSYSAYAETTADRGIDGNSNDFISVSVTFNEYNDKYDATYPDPPGSHTSPVYPSYNVGPNYTMARVNATGYNPDSVSGYHSVQRGNQGWSGLTSVSYTSGN